jgi:hypothetical protein
MQDWFETLFGFSETNAAKVRQSLIVDGPLLRSKVNGRSFEYGQLEVVSLKSLRARVAGVMKVGTSGSSSLDVMELVGDAKALHADPSNTGAVFQVASQFNLLEMVSPSVAPEQGVTIYENDPTQGPACAMACSAGTVFRNYFIEIDGQIGQTATKQVDCLAEIGRMLGNVENRLWNMKNGYALPTAAGLVEIDSKLKSMSTEERDQLAAELKIGLQWNSQVTLNGCEHRVTQAYCSALPVAYSRLPLRHWESFARLILDAAYEATFAAAILNQSGGFSDQLYLTLLGGGAFGNEPTWILDAIRRAIRLYGAAALKVKIVSFRQSNPSVRQLCTR